MKLFKKTILITIIISGNLFSLSGIIDSTTNHWGAGGNVPSPVTIDGRITVGDKGVETSMVPSKPKAGSLNCTRPYLKVQI